MIVATSIFDLRGPEFLQLYLVLMILNVGAALVLRRLIRGPGGEPTPSDLSLDPYDIAYLSGGRIAAVTTAVAALVQRGLLKVEAKGHFRRTSAVQPNNLHMVERLALASVKDGDSTSAWLIRERTAALISAGQLESRELVLSPQRKSLLSASVMLPTLLVLVIGIIKIGVGLQRNKPVTILVMMSIFLTVIGMAIAFAGLLRTRKGDRALAALRTNNSALRTTASARPQQLAADDLLLAWALFGPAVFAASVGTYRYIAKAFVPNSNGTSSCGWAGCGSSSCGGGGCGGGGCGGCGGG